MKPRMPARDSAPLYAHLLAFEWAIRRMLSKTDGDSYMKFLHQESDSRHSNVYEIAVRAIDGKL